METLGEKFKSGIKRKRNKEYDALTSKIAWLQKTKPKNPEIRRLAIERRTIPSVDMFDADFKRLMYIRYADDFVILVIGSLNDSKKIKH